MRELAPKEVVVQIWSHKNPNGVELLELTQKLSRDIVQAELGRVGEIEGPTAHIPDYFSELYGQVLGWLIYISEADPEKLKDFVMMYEYSPEKRLCDIDVYTSFFDKISRKKK